MPRHPPRSSYVTGSRHRWREGGPGCPRRRGQRPSRTEARSVMVVSDRDFMRGRMWMDDFRSTGGINRLRWGCGRRRLGCGVTELRTCTYDGGNDLGHGEMAKQRSALFAETSTGRCGGGVQQRMCVGGCAEALRRRGARWSGGQNRKSSNESAGMGGWCAPPSSSGGEAWAKRGGGEGEAEEGGGTRRRGGARCWWVRGRCVV